MKVRWFSIAIACALALAACSNRGASTATAAKQSPAAPSVAATGQPAPAFDEAISTGGSLSQASLKGKPVYLNFFASWCPPCNEEAPSINALSAKYASRGVQVVGVDVLENAAKANEFRQKYHLRYPVLVDGGTLRDAYSINGLPVHVFIDRAGIVKQIVVGEMAPGEIETAIKSIL